MHNRAKWFNFWIARNNQSYVLLWRRVNQPRGNKHCKGPNSRAFLNLFVLNWPQAEQSCGQRFNGLSVLPYLIVARRQVASLYVYCKTKQITVPRIYAIVYIVLFQTTLRPEPCSEWLSIPGPFRPCAEHLISSFWAPFWLYWPACREWRLRLSPSNEVSSAVYLSSDSDSPVCSYRGLCWLVSTFDSRCCSFGWLLLIGSSCGFGYHLNPLWLILPP